MQNNKYLSLTLLAAFFAGCSSMPNNSLEEARQSYSNARSNPQVTNHASIELKEAGDTLAKADAAVSKGESAATIEQIAYVAKQQVAIAEETAKHKVAELEVTNASTKRDQIRLESRTAEADAAKDQAVIAQQNAEQQATALSAAQAKTQSDQARLQERELRLQERTAEAENANQKALLAQQMSDQKTAELAAANAKTTAEAEAAKQQAERDRALIAKQESELKELNAKKTERGMVITLSDVLFSSNKTKLESGGMRSLHKLADFLKQYPERKVLVEGYTDSTGSDDHNQELSERRANAVKTALVDMGISSERISMRGYGKSFPVASNSTSSSRQLNRRVEIILSDEQGNNPAERSR